MGEKRNMGNVVELREPSGLRGIVPGVLEFAVKTEGEMTTVHVLLAPGVDGRVVIDDGPAERFGELAVTAGRRPPREDLFVAGEMLARRLDMLRMGGAVRRVPDGTTRCRLASQPGDRFAVVALDGEHAGAWLAVRSSEESARRWSTEHGLEVVAC